ncbi:MAG: hypothetical protein IIV49_05160, partial [Alistipes sp.]|nr:hypothetical protein [Alistipes sp.]
YPLQSLFPRAARDKNIRQCKGSEKMGKFSNFLLRNFYYFCGVETIKSYKTLFLLAQRAASERGNNKKQNYKPKRFKNNEFD